MFLKYLLVFFCAELSLENIFLHAFWFFLENFFNRFRGFLFIVYYTR